MKKEYNHSIDQIHAPQELIESTKQAMKQEEQKPAEAKYTNIKKKSDIYVWRKVTIAASICLVALGGGFGYYKTNNYVIVDTSVFADSNSLEAGLSLGKIDMEGTNDNLKIEQFEERTELLNKLWEANPSKIKGIIVYIVQGEADDSFYGAYKKDESYFLITGSSVSEEEFLTYLKENL